MHKLVLELCCSVYVDLTGVFWDWYIGRKNPVHNKLMVLLRDVLRLIRFNVHIPGLYFANG